MRTQPLAQAPHHVAILVADLERATRFYVDVLGMSVHATRANWLMVGGQPALHLIEVPARDVGPRYPMEHVALRVASLETVRAQLLAHGLTPWQNGLDWSQRDITDESSSLDWGLGTLFVRDPDGNAIEFVQDGRGIFAQHL
jgi:catechol 2,3-dioxygenase-like lactoylglutathione lyase family enzyme